MNSNPIEIDIQFNFSFNRKTFVKQILTYDQLSLAFSIEFISEIVVQMKQTPYIFTTFVYFLPISLYSLVLFIQFIQYLCVCSTYVKYICHHHNQ